MQQVFISSCKRTRKFFMRFAGRLKHVRWHHKCSIIQSKCSFFLCFFIARRRAWYHVTILPRTVDIKPLNIAVILN